MCIGMSLVATSRIGYMYHDFLVSRKGLLASITREDLLNFQKEPMTVLVLSRLLQTSKIVFAFKDASLANGSVLDNEGSRGL